MSNDASIGNVTSRLTLDSASFDAKLEKSSQGLDRHAALTEKASARARAAWEKELVAQEKAERALEATSRAKELAALKADILSRSVENEARAQEHAGESTITSMQATAASLRALEGGFNNNLRSMERWVSQSSLVSNAAKSMFQFVGAGTFGFLIAGMLEEVAEFINKVREMPKAIEEDFASLNLASHSSTDALRLTNDTLQNSIDKLEHRPQNNVKIAMDEAREAADKLATSIENGNKKLNDLLSKDHLTFWAAFMGQIGTAGREGTTKAFSDQLNSNAYELANATASGDPSRIAKAKKAIADTENAQMAEARKDLEGWQAAIARGSKDDVSAIMNMDKGIITQILNQQANDAEEARNADLSAKKQKLEAAKAAGLEAANAAREASAAKLHAMDLELNQDKLLHAMSIKETFDFWSDRLDAFKKGSQQYNEIVARQAQLATAGAAKAHEVIAKARASQSAQDARAGMESIGLTTDRIAGMMLRGRNGDAAVQANGMVDSNQLAIVDAHNLARAREAQIMDEAGRSMTRYAAAVELADVHAKEYAATMQALEAILHDRELIAGLNPSKENNRALAMAQGAIASAQANRQIQVRGDSRATNGTDSSSLVGAKDALDEFVMSTRDASQQMREFVGSLLNGLNSQILNGVTGQKTNFSGAAVGMLRGAASIGLNKAEGSVLSMFGFGGSKKPTGSSDDPLHVVMAKSGIPGAAAGAISKVAGGGVSGFLGSLLTSFLPHFATGGAIAPDTWAMVGERGPEPFYSGSGGTILPHEALNSLAGSGGGQQISYTIDARGTDPVQTEMRVRSAIVAAHQSATKQAVKQVNEDSRRRPTRSR